ncbi:copper resistance system multicopper oxidase [Immundisolibacter sp.]|uniref:copper resistance system multicopper oxidase n=1 Tax=Immundisolibacter sp. TaxID=1934948 RepID=UPI00262E4C73|nr:copper resistance system multicopper oxidase [Immundisolibacter sp.]MDD3650303.1 copper resistance system multicopper oxidase [Immundisolibacter sp.]
MSMPWPPRRLTRRRLLGGLAAGGLLAGVDALLPGWARPLSGAVAAVPPGPVSVDLTVARERIDIAGKRAFAHTLNGSVPGPLIELYEGQEARLRVRNTLDDEDASIHWHGILLPFEMDGVPGVSFPGIRPGETFEARFPVRQAGTYWYHSHSGLQEQTGVYGPLVIHPAGGYAEPFERDYVVLLSDWTHEDPRAVLAKLKKVSHYYNFQEQTLPQVLAAGQWQQWLAWQRMRMSPTDIADVTGYTYTYLMNGLHPAGNWTGLFAPGERVRLRFINGSAMTYFNLRIPGLPMTVVQADGQDVQPVETDELQIAIAETYDVIVTPQDRAYTVFAESMDRSGFAAGTLAPRAGMTAAIPALRRRPLRTMTDMGMDHAGHGGHGGGAMSGPDTTGMDHAAMGHAPSADPHAGHAAMGHTVPDPHAGHAMGGSPPVDHAAMGHVPPASGPRSAKTGVERAAPGPVLAVHGADNHGVGNAGVAQLQRDRTAEPGTGLADVDHRVLVYADLLARTPTRDTRPPARDIELHLTGHMERYMWSFDGKKFSQVHGPILFRHGERLRLTLVNDTMMEHPIHLHGMFFEVDNGAGAYRPRKHTVSVKPAERLRLLITADEPGRWAFHCHLLYHMHMGMMRVVEVA